MPFAVVPADGMTTDAEYEAYSWALVPDLLQLKVDMAEVPRVEDSGTPGRWFYAWPTEAEAVAFAHGLKPKGKDKGRWVVRAVEDPSVGPLRPIEIEFGGPRIRVAFGLAPWTYLAMRVRFPGCCQTQTVRISSGRKADRGPIEDEYRRLARQLLPILTGLDLGQLEVYEAFVVVDPVTKVQVVPLTPLVSRAFETAETPEMAGTAR